MRILAAGVLLGLGGLLGGLGAAHAQVPDSAAADSVRPWYEDAWTPIVQRQGVAFSYLFYSKADNANNGVVLRLQNRNDYPVRYDVTVLFRGPGGEAQARAQGHLAPGEMKTGEPDGLFWIPFTDGRTVGAIGLRGIDIQRADPSAPPRTRN